MDRDIILSGPHKDFEGIKKIDENGVELWNFTSSSDDINAIIAYDLDSDGEDEILYGNEAGNVFALDRNGNLLWEYYINKGGIGEPDGNGDSAVLDASDINNDGLKDIGVLSEQGYAYIFNHMNNCSIKFNSTTNYNMSWNESSKKWEYDITLGTAGQHNYNITCAKDGYETQVFNGNVTIDAGVPIITIQNPTNSTYNATNVSLIVYADKVIDTWWLANNTQGNITFNNASFSHKSVKDNLINKYYYSSGFTK